MSADLRGLFNARPGLGRYRIFSGHWRWAILVQIWKRCCMKKSWSDSSPQGVSGCRMRCCNERNGFKQNREKKYWRLLLTQKYAHLRNLVGGSQKATQEGVFLFVGLFFQRATLLKQPSPHRSSQPFVLLPSPCTYKTLLLMLYFTVIFI